MPHRPRSAQAFERACRLIPGGVNSPARAFGAVGGQPPFIARGAGPYLYDLDGHRYLDYVGSWGPLILGHAHPRVVAAVAEALRDGASFGTPTERESELAELIVAAVPSMEMVRMVSSGTEASMSAIRLARGFTGRDVIVKFAGCYHGHVDSLLVAAGSSATTLGVPNSPGVPRGTTADTLVLRFNDPGALEDAFTAHGGAQELYGQRPDLTVLGKVVGGGLPVGAYGGRADIMKHVMPAGPVFQAGTLSGNP